MTPDEHRTVEVDIMTLFNEINRKLDALPGTVALKADSAALGRLEERFTDLSIRGSANAQTAVAGVAELKEKISSLGWKVALALVGALAAGGGTVFIGLKH